MSGAHRTILTALAAALLVSTAAHAQSGRGGGVPDEFPVTKSERVCQTGRANAAANYASCALKAVASIDFQKLRAPNDGQVIPGYNEAMGRCRRRYAATWRTVRAQAKGTGSTCDNPRFMDGGDGTVTDRLTGLQWEKKDDLDGRSDFANPHDADNRYYYTLFDPTTPANGTLFTDFIGALNGAGGCFAGQCDWRMPSRDELATIGVVGIRADCDSTPLNGNPPCIEPVFGPTFPTRYSTATTFPTIGVDAWYVDFGHFAVGADEKNGAYGRAVRGGL